MHSEVAQEPWSPANPERPGASPGLQLPAAAAAARRVAQSRPSGGKECGPGGQWQRNAATAWRQRRAMRTRRERTPLPAPAGLRPKAVPAAQRAAQPPRRGPQAAPNWDARPIRAQNLCTAHSPEKRWSPGTAPRTFLCPYASGPWQSCMAGHRPPLPTTKKNPTARRVRTQAGGRAPSAQLEPRDRNLAAQRPMQRCPAAV